MIKSKDIPESFDIELITKFLRQSQVTINGEALTAVEKPVVKGRQLYHSRKIIDCKFMITVDMLLFDSVMDASMEKDKR